MRSSGVVILSLCDGAASKLSYKPKPYQDDLVPDLYIIAIHRLLVNSCHNHDFNSYEAHQDMFSAWTMFQLSSEWFMSLRSFLIEANIKIHLIAK